MSYPPHPGPWFPPEQSAQYGPGQPPHPGGPQAGPYPQQGAGQQAQQAGPSWPTGQLVLQLHRPWGSMGMLSPRAWIDGYHLNVHWGANRFVVPTGTRGVQIQVQALWDYGRAADAVSVAAGQQVEVHYSPPLFAFLAGHIGPTQMPAPGRTGMFVSVVVVAAIIAVLLVFMFVNMISTVSG